MKTIIALNSDFSKTYCILIFFSSRCLQQFQIHNKKKSHKKVCVHILIYIFFSNVNNSCFVFPSLPNNSLRFTIKKKEDIIAKIRPFEFSKNKSKQTLYSSCIGY